MFAALTVVRLREAVTEEGLGGVRGWISRDEVEPENLPLARAAEKVLASMHAVLVKTKNFRDEVLEREAAEDHDEKKMHLIKTKAAEVRLVRKLDDLRHPVVQFKAEGLESG